MAARNTLPANLEQGSVIIGTGGLDSFLTPRSIAIIGAAPAKERTIRGNLMRVLRQCRYDGQIFPVNPSRAEIDGLRCYPSIGDVDGKVDLAIIAIPAQFVCNTVEECAARGVGAVIVISSGFAEEGAEKAALQSQLTETARRTGMRICGPNCEGFFNLADGVAATFSTAAEPAGTAHETCDTREVAVVAQSGGLGFAMLNRGRALGLRFGHIVTTGNECDLTAVDFISHFARSAAIKVIIAYLEEIRDIEGFRTAVRYAHSAGKSVIALKVGKSDAARRAARAHTGSTTGSHDDNEAMFTELGVILVAEPDEAIAAALARIANPVLAGNLVGIVTTAGGAGTVLCDSLAAAGFMVPALSETLQASLRPTFPSYGSAANPVDVTAQGIFTGGAMRALEVLLEGDEVDLIVFAVSLSSERNVSLDVDAFQKLCQRSRKPILVYSYTLPSRLAREALSRAGLPVFAHIRDLLVAARALRALHPSALVNSADVKSCTS